MKILTCPAPRRACVDSQGGYYNRAWTKEDVLEALRGGAWFAKSGHDFADAAATRAAGLKPQAEKATVSDWIKKLPREQLRILKDILTKE